MKNDTRNGFSRREQEMMDIVYRLGRATAAEIRENMAAPPSYSSVRSTLSSLERKGHLMHEYDGNRYIYGPTVRRENAGRSALDHLLTTFFDGSAAAVVATLLENGNAELSTGELEELSNLIEQTRKEGR
jgi:predicted transcriptional regulator